MPHWSEAGVEPSLNELLSDPVVEIILRYDRLTRDDVRRAIHDAQTRLYGPPRFEDAKVA